jgi:hypothetical protein
VTGGPPRETRTRAALGVGAGGTMRVHYKACGHVVERRDDFDGIAFVDVGGWCPACKPLHARRRKPKARSALALFPELS